MLTSTSQPETKVPTEVSTTHLSTPHASNVSKEEKNQMTTAATGESDRSWYVSTGRLPPPERVKTLVAEAYSRFKSNAEGNADYEFTIMSVSKPFVFALVCQELGVEDARRKIGVNATGLAFNSLAGI